jgi:hypothetical protein
MGAAHPDGTQTIALTASGPFASSFAALSDHVNQAVFSKAVATGPLPCSSRGAINSIDKNCGGAGKTLSTGKTFSYARYHSTSIGTIDIVFGDINPSSGARPPILTASTAASAVFPPTSFPGITRVDGGFVWMRVTPPGPLVRASDGTIDILAGQRWRVIGTRTVTGGAKCGIVAAATMPPESGSVVPLLDRLYLVNPSGTDTACITPVTNCVTHTEWYALESFYDRLPNLSLSGATPVADGSLDCKFLADVNAIVADVFSGNTNVGLNILPGKTPLPAPPPTVCKPVISTSENKAMKHD